jgi:hypothetical protein
MWLDSGRGQMKNIRRDTASIRADSNSLLAGATSDDHVARDRLLAPTSSSYGRALSRRNTLDKEDGFHITSYERKE